MAVYAIGDVQGCKGALDRLLSLIAFDPRQDTLWFTGDLVNRGPDSLQVLRFVKALGEPHQTVLGNHDLHLLAVAYGAANTHHTDTLASILAAPDCAELMDWLRFRPLFVYDEALGYALAHAGLAPAWTLKEAAELAHEVEQVLRSENPLTLLQTMYGNQPDQWDTALSGADRLRCIVNYFTRMRFCYPDGRLALSDKGGVADKPSHLLPWFAVSGRANSQTNIIFGHWAALGGKTDVPRVFALDTGCVWGNCLTAMRLGDHQRFSIPC